MVSAESEKDLQKEGQGFLEHLQKALRRAQIHYEMIFHRNVLIESGGAACFFSKEIVKGVLLCADDRLVMVVLPVNAEIDLEIIKTILQADLLRPASPLEIEHLFPSNFLEGNTSAPPEKRNLPPAYVDLSLLENEMIAFSTGRGNPLIRMKTVDFLKLVSPTFGDFRVRRVPLRP